MTRSVFDRVASILRIDIGVPEKLITPAATFVSMEMDSFAQVDFAVMVDLELDVDLDNERYHKVRTLGELVFEIEREIAMRARAAA